MSDIVPTRDEILGNFRTGRYHALNDCRWSHFLSLGIPILDKRVFEPGAGVGDQTEWLLSQGAKYIYVNEGRADNRAIIRERFLTNPKVSIIHGDLEMCLSELDFYVDLIFCFGVYYHLRESEDFRILKEFPRLGKTFVFDYLAGNDNEVYYGYDNPSTSLSQYGYRPRRETVNAALKSCWEFVYLPIIPLAWTDPVATEDRVVAIASHVKLDSPHLESI